MTAPDRWHDLVLLAMETAGCREVIGFTGIVVCDLHRDEWGRERNECPAMSHVVRITAPLAWSAAMDYAVCELSFEATADPDNRRGFMAASNHLLAMLTDAARVPTEGDDKP